MIQILKKIIWNTVSSLLNYILQDRYVIFCFIIIFSFSEVGNICLNSNFNVDVWQTIFNVLHNFTIFSSDNKLNYITLSIINK